MKKIYLAGPEVFLPDAKTIGEHKKILCAHYGFEGLYPLDNEVDLSEPNADMTIYKANASMIAEADYGILNLTPFRGIGADPGTVYELGTMVGMGKTVGGYTTSTQDLFQRMVEDGQVKRGESVDKEGWFVEDFGNHDNLMIDCSLRLGFNRFVSSDCAIDDLRPFEQCLKYLRELTVS